MATPSLDRARALLRESGYAGERVMMLNPSDFPSIAPLGLIANDLMARIGFNMDFVTTDWGYGRCSACVNRGRRLPAAGTSYPVWWSGMGIVTPTQNALIRGQGLGGWSGWYESAEMEALNGRWLAAPDEAARLAHRRRDAGRWPSGTCRPCRSASSSSAPPIAAR